MSALKELGPPVVAVAIALGLWEAAVRLAQVPAWLLPPPSAVAAALDGDAHRLVAATMRTGGASLTGFGLAAVLGIALGAVLAKVEPLRRGVYPLTNLLQMVPLVAVAPLLTIWFGYGGKAVVASAVIVSVFPVIAGTVDGLRSVDPTLRELFRIYRASPWRTFAWLEMPAAAPSIFTGLKVAAGLAVIGAIVGEFVSGFGGDDAPLGIVILAALREARTDLVFAAIALSAVVGFTVFGLVSLTGDLVLRSWHPSAKGEPPRPGRSPGTDAL